MFKIYDNAYNLPEIWDEIVGDHPFLKRDALRKLQDVNPCSQRYHLNLEKKIALVSYKLKIDLFTFSKYFTFKIPVNIIGVPMSVSKCGYVVGNQDNMDDLTRYIKSLKGFYVILNSQDLLKIARGKTLPTCKIDIQWDTLDDYMSSMRSHYRYRMKKAMEKFARVKVEELIDNSQFDEKMYDLYVNVYNRSNEKLEKLSIDFFRNFPSKIIKFSVDDEAIAFIQLAGNGDELVFLFGGFIHGLNQKYDLYMNILLEIIKYGIEKGYKHIDLGQTAEETKLKLGAIQHTKYMYVHHSNSIMDAIISRLIDKFSYSHYEISHRVFKEEKDEGSVSKMS